MRFVAWGALFVSLSIAAPARAQAVFKEFHGIRSLAMGGAHRGLGNSNDTLLLNPAGMVMARRYSVDLSYAFDSGDDLSHMAFTAVDSKSGPVAGALGYTHVRGDTDGADPGLHKLYLGVAYPIMANLGFGITARNIRGKFTDDSGERRKIDVWTGDVGIATRASQGFGLGLSFSNIIRTDVPKMTPPTVGFGASYSANFLSVAADIVADTRKQEWRYGYHAGAEYFASGTYPIRVGYRREPFVRKKDGTDATEDIVAFGLGWVNQGGAIEATFSQSLERGKQWDIAGALKFFL